VKWFRKAAEQGYAAAQYNLGVCYKKGEGVSQDKAEAVNWYRKAAEQGVAKAQYNLGVCYDNGEGVSQDKAEAVKWFKAAEQGYALAQYNLGFCYEYGQGVSTDKPEAVKWYRKAAEQGYAAAQYNLGVCYKKGEGVSQDTTEAVKWYRKAAEQGHDKARERLKKIEGSCFISTATAESLGWLDDGPELTLLRKLRDTYMQQTPQRRAEVAEYYRIAPKIVRRINARPDASQVYQWLCDQYILPVLAAIRSGNNSEAYSLYRSMVDAVTERYLDQVDSSKGTSVNSSGIDDKSGARTC